MKPKKKMGCVFLGVLCSQNTLVLYCTQILRIVEVVLGSTQFIRSEPVYYTSTSNETPKKRWGVCFWVCYIPKIP